MPANIPTIQSPGIEIKEFDRSQRTPAPGGTVVYVNGFADQGPTDEVVGISSLSEFTNVYGIPKNAAERYFHYTVAALFNSTANILVNRLPYGAGSGVGFGSYYTALVYPVQMFDPVQGQPGTQETTTFSLSFQPGIQEVTEFTFSTFSSTTSASILSSSAVAIADERGTAASLSAFYWQNTSNTSVQALTSFVNSVNPGAVFNLNYNPFSNSSMLSGLSSRLVGEFNLDSTATTLTATMVSPGTVFRTASALGGITSRIPTTGISTDSLANTVFAVQVDNGKVFSYYWASALTTTAATLTGYVAAQGGTNTRITSFPSTLAGMVSSVNILLSSFIGTAVDAAAGTIVTTQSAERTVTYPASAVAPTNNVVSTRSVIGTPYISSITSNLNAASGIYFLGAPKQFVLNKEQYVSLTDGSGFTWNEDAVPINQINTISTFGRAGLIVLNKAQTVVDQKYQGYYLGVIDNLDADNPGSNFDKIRNAYTVTQSAFSTTSFTSVPDSTLNFTLTSSFNRRNGSISEIVETASNGYVIGNINKYDDVLNVVLFKLRQSVFQDNPNTLIYTVEENYTGSITDPLRQFSSSRGGEPVNYYLGNMINSKSSNMNILVNPYITNTALDSIGKGTSYDPNSSDITKKKVRMISRTLVNNFNTLSSYVGFDIDLEDVNQVASNIGYADALYPVGAFSDEGFTNKIIGDVPAKVDRALEKVRNDELFDLDVIVEGGLGTIYAWTNTTGLTSYDDSAYNEQFTTSLGLLQTSNIVAGSNDVRDAYTEVFTEFSSFAAPYQDGGRGDVFFVADPIRHIFINGADTRTLDKPGKIFSKDIYWGLRNLYNTSGANSSYIGVYANWVKVSDQYSGKRVWVPISGFAAGRMAATDTIAGPWNAPAGYTRGVLRDAIDIAFSPNQRQRDDLYKVSLNPVAAFPGQGNVIFGQKTLQSTPSAFDRINVRRLFLYMEKAVKKAVKFFVFEPNTKYTRDRVKATLDPFFRRIQAADGLYEYLLVCDERNNTPEVIDNNTLVVDVYIKPVRTAEFIIVNFYATRTDTNFEELAGKL